MFKNMWDKIKKRLLKLSRKIRWAEIKRTRHRALLKGEWGFELNRLRPTVIPLKGWAKSNSILRFLFIYTGRVVYNCRSSNPKIFTQYTDEEELIYLIEYYKFKYLWWKLHIPYGFVQWYDFLEILLKDIISLIFPILQVHVNLPITGGIFSAAVWRLNRLWDRKKQREELLFFSQLFSFKNRNLIRPQQSYEHIGETDVGSVWLTHLRINRIMFTLLRNLEVSTRNRTHRQVFSFKNKMSLDSGRRLVLRNAMFRHGFFKYVQPRKFTAITAVGKSRVYKLSHYTGRRDFVVRRYTKKISRTFNGGHPLWRPSGRPSLLKISEIERESFRPERKRLLITYFFLLRGFRRDFDHSSRISFKKHSDLNRGTWRYFNRRFRTGCLLDSSTVRIYFWRANFFPLSLWRYWWESMWENPYYSKSIHTYWWAFGAKKRKYDFPWRGALLRPMLYGYRTDKVTDWLSRSRFLRYYDEAHYTYGPGMHDIRARDLGFTTQGLMLWRMEMIRLWNRRKPAFRYKEGSTFRVYMASRYWRDRVWLTPLGGFFTHTLNGARWPSKRKLHRYFNRNRRVFMFFYHSSFLWVGSNRMRHRYLGVERSRFSKASLGQNKISYFIKNKYASFGQFLTWGSDFINTWYAKERLQFAKDYTYMTSVESRPRIYRRYIFSKRGVSGLTMVLERFSWIKSGTYFLNSRETRQTRREAGAYESSPRLVFYYKWRRKSYSTRDKNAYEKGNREFLRWKVLFSSEISSLIWSNSFIDSFWLMHDWYASDTPFWWLQQRQREAYVAIHAYRLEVDEQKTEYYYAWWYPQDQLWNTAAWDGIFGYYDTFDQRLDEDEHPVVEEDFFTTETWATDCNAFVFLRWWRRRFYDRLQLRNYIDKSLDYDLETNIYTPQLEAVRDVKKITVKWELWLEPRFRSGWTLDRRRFFAQERFIFYYLYEYQERWVKEPYTYDAHAELQDAGRSDGVTGFNQRGFLWHRFTKTAILMSVAHYYLSYDDLWHRPNARKWNLSDIRYMRTSKSFRAGMRKV